MLLSSNVAGESWMLSGDGLPSVSGVLEFYSNECGPARVYVQFFQILDGYLSLQTSLEKKFKCNQPINNI